MKFNLTRKQGISILAIIVIGILLGALIMLTDENHSHGGNNGHSDSGAGHDEGKRRTDSATAGQTMEPHGEEKIVLDDSQIKAAGISIEKAGPATIISGIILPGEIKFNEDRTVKVVPRLAGVVENVPANLGDKVKKGQVLAVIASSDLSEQRSELLSAQKRLALAKTTYERERQLWQEKISAEQDFLQAKHAFNEAEIAVQNAREKLNAIGAEGKVSGALNRYEIRAPFDSTVMDKHISLGEALQADTSIFTLSDLSSVWAEVAVPAKDLNIVQVGGKVTIQATELNESTTGTIAYVGSLLGEQTRTAKARVVLANPNAAWRPGLFVNVEVESSQKDVAVAISTDAVHNINDKPTIFTHVPGGFLAQEVALGHSNSKTVEVIKGLDAGTAYAKAGSFILKSELGKASAEHAH